MSPDQLSYDDVGDPGGHPVLYLHGTPDSRLARHPDDSLAAAAGIRLLAVDRPGYGDTPAGVDFPGAVAGLLDILDLRSAALMAWSGGVFDALRTAAALPDRIAALHLVATVVPARAELVEMVEVLGVEAVAGMMAPWPCDRALALELQRENRDPAEQKRLAAVDGGVGRMADALVEAVRNGLDGVVADVQAMTRPLEVDLAAVTAPTVLWYGDEDPIAPVPVGQWYAGQLPDATLVVTPGAGHFLPFTHWELLLRRVGPAPGGTEPLA